VLCYESPRRSGRRIGLRFAVAALPFGCAIVIPGLVGVAAGADTDLLFYVRVAIPLAIFLKLLPYISGISPRDDLVERDNPAAAIAVSGAILAIMPAIYVIPLAADGNYYGFALSGIVLMGAWLILSLFTRISEAITVDRDIGAGLRLAAFLLALGIHPALGLASMLRGGGAAPDPGSGVLAALPPLVAAILLEQKWLKPTYPPKMTRSLLAAGLYLALGAGAAARLR
jgi:hypothetical protein